MPINQAPIRIFMEVPRFRSSERTSTGTAIAIAARVSRAVARIMQSLLLALHESRFEKARREIDSLRHLIPPAKEVMTPHAPTRCGGGDQREPARKSAEARREPSQAA